MDLVFIPHGEILLECISNIPSQNHTNKITKKKILTIIECLLAAKENVSQVHKY